MNEDRMEDDAIWLDAGLDGELDAARSLALERRLAGDPAFRARWEARRGLRAAVRGATSYHEAPAALRARIEAALDGEATSAEVAVSSSRTARATPAPMPAGARPGAVGATRAHAGSAAPGAARRPGRAWTWPWLAASGLGGACAAALLTLLAVEPLAWHGRNGAGQVVALAPEAGDGAQAGLAAEAVSAHTRALLVDETIEIASSDRHTVRPWLAARLNFVPAIEDFAAEGYPLAGARRDVIGGETAAALVYRHGAHVISVFVRPLREAPGAGSGAGAAAERAPTLRTVRGFNVVEMTHAGMAYSLVSDMNVHEMAELAELLRRPAG
jgi:anti-sigma factor RsiW